MPRLLIVSDDPRQQKDIKAAAIAAGYRADEMTCPDSWEDAVRAQKGGDFQVAVVDILLWGSFEGGVDYIRQFHIEQPACRIIALTEHSGDDTGVRAMRAGAADFINVNWNVGPWTEYLTRKLTLYLHLAEPPQ